MDWVIVLWVVCILVYFLYRRYGPVQEQASSIEPGGGRMLGLSAEAKEEAKRNYDAWFSNPTPPVRTAEVKKADTTAPRVPATSVLSEDIPVQSPSPVLATRRGGARRGNDNREKLVSELGVCPNCSERELAGRTGISKSQVHRIMDSLTDEEVKEAVSIETHNSSVLSQAEDIARDAWESPGEANLSE